MTFIFVPRKPQWSIYSQEISRHNQKNLNILPVRKHVMTHAQLRLTMMLVCLEPTLKEQSWLAAIFIATRICSFGGRWSSAFSPPICYQCGKSLLLSHFFYISTRKDFYIGTGRTLLRTISSVPVLSFSSPSTRSIILNMISMQDRQTLWIISQCNIFSNVVKCTLLQMIRLDRIWRRKTNTKGGKTRRLQVRRTGRRKSFNNTKIFR